MNQIPQRSITSLLKFTAGGLFPQTSLCRAFGAIADDLANGEENR
jgi:hypothetical protein